MSLDQTAIWTVFQSKADDDARSNLRHAVDEASALLDRVVETFPTYTLHNRDHALNVVTLMGKLLGPAVEDLTALECAFLILAAYFHDTGMYVQGEELAGLEHEEWFSSFIEAENEAFIAYETNGRALTEDLAEWYCRWSHADRVYVVLARMQEERLSWGIVSIRDKLAEVCRSHNLDLRALKDDDVFETNYLQKADLRMCAILLRLADILDFDRTRTPESVYATLGLAAGSTARLRASNDEWRKHRAAEGFVFPKGERRDSYALPFIAAPDDPALEHDMRAFLDDIDDELKGCAALLQSCSPRWRDAVLPRAIARDDIRPRGYVYGDYRFELDRQQVLKLFMGEDLYSNTFVFVRELMQNAIDTVRHRTLFEHSLGRGDFEPAAIDVRECTDDEGYRWIIVEDEGMGMSEQLVRRYFLSVGRSFYRSSDFRAEMLRFASRSPETFTPISRFGIGALSCFIAGDRVEVSTRRVKTGATAPPAVRLSLHGLESYYVTQVHPMPARPMPGDSMTGGYRTKPGTTIAVRIDPSKGVDELVLETVLRQYVLASPVPVTVRGKPFEQASEDLIEGPWLDEPKSISTGIPTSAQPEWVRASGSYAVPVGVPPAGEVEVRIVPLDLTAVSPDPRFRGQMALLVAASPPGHQAGVATSMQNHRWNLTAYDDDDAGVAIDLADAFGSERGRIGANVLQREILWSHNGVVLPDAVHVRLVETGQTLEVNFPLSEFFSCGRTDNLVGLTLVGCLAFSDDLGVDLSASRDVARGIPWSIQSIVQLALIRAFERASAADTDALLRANNIPLDFDYLASPVPSLGVLVSDPLLLRADGWLRYRLITVDAETQGLYSSTRVAVDALRERIASRTGPVEVGSPSFSDMQTGEDVEFPEVIAAGLLRSSVELAWDEGRLKRGAYFATAPAAGPISDGELLLPPLFTMPYLHRRELRFKQGPLNRDHPFTRWFIEACVPLSEHQPSAFATLRRRIAQPYPRDIDGLYEHVKRINDVLDRLRRVDLKPAVPPDLVLKPSDFA